MGPPKESLEKKNIFIEKYDKIRRLDGILKLFDSTEIHKYQYTLKNVQISQ